MCPFAKRSALIPIAVLLAAGCAIGVEETSTTNAANATPPPHGFRPERSQHDALDAVTVGLTRRKVNWVLDADIRGFFDTLNHEWLVKFVEHQIADARVVRLIRK